MRRVLVFTALCIAAAAPVLAQDSGDDWELVRQPDEKSVLAFVPMTSGLAIGFRCVDGDYGAVIAGLPEAGRRDQTRTLRIKIGDGEFTDTRWNVTTDRAVAIADYPAPLARRMRAGGLVSIVIPGGAEGGRNLRHELDLPVSSAAIDETLNACGRPLTDPRDALLPEIEADGLPDGVTWARPPRPRYPSMTRYAQGYAVLSCLVRPDGGTRDCVVESEFPTNAGFGRNALRGAEDARVNSPGEIPGQYAPRIVAFRVTYRMG